jgi:hypothetical protein
MVLLGGCISGPQQGQPGGEAPVVISIWHTLNAAEEDVLQDQLLEALAAHPGILARLKQVPDEELAWLVTQAQAGGRGPEMMIASDQTLLQLYTQGSLRPLPGAGASVPETAREYFQTDGQMIAQPWLAVILTTEASVGEPAGETAGEIPDADQSIPYGSLLGIAVSAHQVNANNAAGVQTVEDILLSASTETALAQAGGRIRLIHTLTTAWSNTEPIPEGVEGDE